MGPQRPSPDELRRRAAGAWLTDAYADLANACSLAAHRDEGTAPFASAFHAEQAVEKGVKALLVWHARGERDCLRFIAYVMAQTQAATISNNAIQVMTIHKAKGLEFDAVFLPDLHSPAKANLK